MPHSLLFPIVAAWDETPALRGVRLVGPEALLRRYQVPGQYLEVEDAEGVRGYFALAAAPDGRHLELLVRRGSKMADEVAALPAGAGAHLRVIDVLGQGYPIAQQRGRDLLLAAAGSGIAPIRAVLQQVLRDRGGFGAINLYYGQRRPSELAYAGDFDAWRRKGVQVEPVLSEGQGSGYVQDGLRREPSLGPRTSALLCGMPAMVEAAAQVLAERGVPRDRIFLNY